MPLLPESSRIVQHNAVRQEDPVNLPSEQPSHTGVVKRRSLFVVAFHHFPSSFLAKGIGVTATSFPLIFKYLLENFQIESVIDRGIITAAIIGVVPTVALFLITLVRAPRIRKREEAEAARQQHIEHGDRNARKVKEEKEEQEVVRLEEVASGNLTARIVKDKQEDERWELLNKVLRAQDKTGQYRKEEREVERQEFASGELIARQVKDRKEDLRWDILNEKLRVQQVAGQQTEDLKEERETARQELASVDLEARKVKDLKENERWDTLNERLRAQQEAERQTEDLVEERETARQELASDELKAQKVKDLKEDERWDILNERLRIQQEAGQQTEDLKEEREIARQALASVDLKAQKIKDLKETERWDLLNERLRVQEETGQQTKDQREERDTVASDRSWALQKQTAFGDAKARLVKDLKETERWEQLNERLRIQDETADDRSSARQHSHDLREEQDALRREASAVDDAKVQHAKDLKEDERWDALQERWNSLHDRMRVQEERSEKREEQQHIRDDEYRQMRREDQLRNQYEMLYKRFQRQSALKGPNPEIEDGLAPIPEKWLKKQPEILKEPALLEALRTLNDRS